MTQRHTTTQNTQTPILTPTLPTNNTTSHPKDHGGPTVGATANKSTKNSQTPPHHNHTHRWIPPIPPPPRQKKPIPQVTTTPQHKTLQDVASIPTQQNSVRDITPLLHITTHQHPDQPNPRTPLQPTSQPKKISVPKCHHKYNSHPRN